MKSSCSESDLEDSDLDGEYQPIYDMSCEELEESASESDDASAADDESNEETPECNMVLDNEKQNVFLWTKNRIILDQN